MNFKHKYLKYKNKYLNQKSIKDSNFNDEKEYYLVSSEGDKFKVKKKIAEFSNLAKVMLSQNKDDEDLFEIPLPNVSSDVMVKVIEFSNYHVTNGPMKQIQKPLQSTNMEKIVDEWDAQFVNNLNGNIFSKLIKAAYYLEIKSLLVLLLAKVASMIKGMTPEEIRQTFKVKRDFTQQEYIQVKNEGLWESDQVEYDTHDTSITLKLDYKN